MDLKIIGKYLKEKRTEAGYTQGELAQILNVSHQAVSRWENGDNLPDVMKLSELSKLYNISMEEILQQEEVSEKEIEDSTVLPTLSILSVVISFFSILLYILLLNSYLDRWIIYLIHFGLIIANSLFYVLPFGMKQTGRTKKDWNYLFLGIMASSVVLMMSFLSIVEDAFYFHSYYYLSGLSLSAITLFILYNLYRGIKHRIYKEPNSYVNEVVKTSIKESWMNAVIALLLTIILIFIVGIISGDVVIIIYMFSLVSLVTMIYIVIDNFNWISVALFIVYLLMTALLLTYISNVGEITEEFYGALVRIGDVYYNSVGYIVWGFTLIVFVLFVRYEKYIKKYTSAILPILILAWLQAIAIGSGDIYFDLIEVHIYDYTFVSGYHLLFDIPATNIFESAILFISCLVVVSKIKYFKSRALSRGN